MEPYDTAKVVAVGASLYVRIPAATCKRMNIVKGTPMNIYRNEEEIIYMKVVA